MSKSPSLQTILRDRADAGRRLVEPLLEYAHRPDVIVLALPRGGVPVAYEVARALDIRLDLMLVRKLGVPTREEFAMGAIASGGIQILNEDALRAHPVDQARFNAVVTRETQELLRREQVYREGRPPLQLKDQVVILIDDGLATGASWLCYYRALQLGQASLVAPVDKLSVVIVAVLGVTLLGEKLDLRQWAGISLITTGVVLLAWRR